MDFFSIIERGARLNPLAARLVVIVPLAAAALALGLKLLEGYDVWTVIIALIVMVVVIVVVLVLIRFGSDAVTVVWFVRFVLTLFAAVSTLFVTCVFFAWPQPLICLLKPLEPCSRLAGYEIARDVPVTEPRPVATLPAIERSGYTVYIQFAGYVRNPTITDLAKNLLSQGWKVPPQERIATAAGLNEVRYRSEKEKAAAELLAAEANKAQPALKKLRIRQVSIIKEGTLEIWVSQ